MLEGCTPEVMMEHVKQMEATKSSVDSAHHRIDGMINLFEGFREEMRDMNKNMSDMNLNVGLLAQEVKSIAQTTATHDIDIKDIKDNMETKDRVHDLYIKFEESDKVHEKGMDAIMTKLRENEEALEDHKMEPALDALEREKKFIRWAVTGVGSIILAIIGGFILMYFGLK